MSLISVKNNIGIPKYKQIVYSVERAINSKEIVKGDSLPSINSIKNRFSLSRDTVLAAYNELKTRGIVESIPGKGYYVKSENLEIIQKVFLLFDEFNSFKEDLYNSFLENLDDNIHVDIYFHHFNKKLFNSLIHDNIGNYNYYVIMPGNLQDTNNVIKKLPHDKVYILDQVHDDLKQYPSIYQNFEKDIYESLINALPHLKKYKKIVLLFPKEKQPLGMLKGFQKFRKEFDFPYEVINRLEDRDPKIGEAYLILDDRSLIVILKKIRDMDLSIGRDIGIISYNDTLLKEIVEGGITTISTDFKGMGKRLAQMLMNNQKLTIENSNGLILRKSL